MCAGSNDPSLIVRSSWSTRHNPTICHVDDCCAVCEFETIILNNVYEEENGDSNSRRASSSVAQNTCIKCRQRDVCFTGIATSI